MFGAKPLVFRKLTDEQIGPYPVSLTDEPRSPEPCGTEGLARVDLRSLSNRSHTPRHSDGEIVQVTTALELPRPGEDYVVMIVKRPA
jgi:hypothetical protein